MTHNQDRTTTVQVQITGRTVLDSVMHKLPSSRKCYRVVLVVPDNGIPIIEYHQNNHVYPARKAKKSIQFVDLLFVDRKHDMHDKYAFSVYTIGKTSTFIAPDEPTMNEWLNRIRECHSNLYPEFKRYEAIFEANLIDKGLARTMNIRGRYRLALCKESLDLIPMLADTQLSATYHLPNHQRFDKRHPELERRKIELVMKSIRRCGHTDSNFYVETGRHSQIGEGGLWMNLSKKSTARQLHEMLLATMKSPPADDQYLYKAPRSRSGSSSENVHRIQPPRPSSLNCNDLDDDSGYLPMA